MIKNKINILIVIIFFTFSIIHSDLQSQYSYAVVISNAAYSETGWKLVADSLYKKHSIKGKSKIFKWSSNVTECKKELSDFRPDFIGYIARPVSECNSYFIATVSRLTRELDDDPYGDAIWGVITGYEADDALRAISESLIVKTVISASGNLSYEPPIQRFYQGIGMTCDSYTKTDYLFPGRGGKIYTEDKRPEGEIDRIKLIAKWINSDSINIEVKNQGIIKGQVDCIITGGHGNVNLWQCHYPDPGNEGYLRSSEGQLYGTPATGGSIKLNSPTPKILWCASNCLMGNPNNHDNIVYAAFHTGHVVQMFGFVNNASSGDEFMAWGIYDRVTKWSGKYTLAEGFFISNNNALFEIRHPTGTINGPIKSYMDSTVFYGDPAGNVKFNNMGDTAHAYKENLTIENDNDTSTFTYSITMTAHTLEFGSGYCYQFRPICRLPVRIDPNSVTIIKNEGHRVEITDNLLIWEILSKGEKLQKGSYKTLQWKAKIQNYAVNTKNEFKINNKSKLTVINNRSVFIYKYANENFLIIITDLHGREYLRKNIDKGKNNKMNITEKILLPTGVYFATLENKTEKISLRFTIIQ